MATLLFSKSVSDKYKEVSEVINAVEPEVSKLVKRTSVKSMMEQSFFHGASWVGYNFIA